MLVAQRRGSARPRAGASSSSGVLVAQLHHVDPAAERRRRARAPQRPPRRGTAGPAAGARARRRARHRSARRVERSRPAGRSAAPGRLTLPRFARYQRLSALYCGRRLPLVRHEPSVKNDEPRVRGRRHQQVLELALHARVLERDRVGLLQVARARLGRQRPVAARRSSRTRSGRAASAAAVRCAARPRGAACRAPCVSRDSVPIVTLSAPGYLKLGAWLKSYGWCA